MENGSEDGRWQAQRVADLESKFREAKELSITYYKAILAYKYFSIFCAFSIFLAIAGTLWMNEVWVGDVCLSCWGK